MAVGDLMLDRYVAREIEHHGTAYPLERVRPVLDAADLVAGNSECPITDRPRDASKRFVFRAMPDYASALKGFDVLSVANNHSLDCGPAGLTDTIANLSLQGIQPVGTAAGEPVVIEKKGIKIAFLAFSDFNEPGDDGVMHYDRERLGRNITAVRRRADVVVVMAHWGVEGSSEPTPRQRAEAKELAMAGADLILGSHPHVLQPVERLGKCVVAYSMGNFVFDAVKAKERETAIFSFEIRARGVDSWRTIPCKIRNARPEPAPAR
jgi:poly-gamma-glutamate synthesis protein (capsule biosynthesis protein)